MALIEKVASPTDLPVTVVQKIVHNVCAMSGISQSIRPTGADNFYNTYKKWLLAQVAAGNSYYKTGI